MRQDEIDGARGANLPSRRARIRLGRTTSSCRKSCRKRCGGWCFNFRRNRNPRGGRKCGGSSRRTNSGAGLQYLWWSEQDQNWHLPFEQKMTDGSSIEDLPRYEFVTNIYQAFGLSLVSVLSQDVPRVRFFPSSAQAEEDVAAAKAATEVAGLVERNNRVGNLIVDEAFQLWTDGKVGAYVRFVVDGQRFGFHPETEIGAREVRIGGDVYVCPECSAETVAGGGSNANRRGRARARADPSLRSLPSLRASGMTEERQELGVAATVALAAQRPSLTRI